MQKLFFFFVELFYSLICFVVVKFVRSHARSSVFFVFAMQLPLTWELSVLPIFLVTFKSVAYISDQLTKDSIQLKVWNRSVFYKSLPSNVNRNKGVVCVWQKGGYLIDICLLFLWNVFFFQEILFSRNSRTFFKI